MFQCTSLALFNRMEKLFIFYFNRAHSLCDEVFLEKKRFIAGSVGITVKKILWERRKAHPGFDCFFPVEDPGSSLNRYSGYFERNSSFLRVELNEKALVQEEWGKQKRMDLQKALVWEGGGGGVMWSRRSALIIRDGREWRKQPTDGESSKSIVMGRMLRPSVLQDLFATHSLNG